MPRLTLPRVLLIIASLGTAVVLQSAVLRASGFREPPRISCLSSSLVVALVAGPAVGAVTGFAGVY